jgi:uncharacterized protein (DUF433 family)
MDRVGKEYVEQRDGGYYIAGTRVSLDSIVHEYHQGTPPESIVREFELLTLEQVHGAIAFYLAHQAEIDAYLQSSESELEGIVLPLSKTKPELYQRLQEAYRRRTAKRP